MKGEALVRSLRRSGALLGAAALAGALAALPAVAASGEAPAPDTLPIKDRHIDGSREGATELPRSEGDQAIVAGWPLYRTERGQAAFNDAMATLKATDEASPAASVFKGCANLACKLSLPSLTPDGWIPAGRIWVSPGEYVLIVHSPRLRDGAAYQRRPPGNMRYFVYHEFHNSTRNTDPFDTISSHSRSVFVSFYMSKTWVDAKGRSFVIVVQIAPHDVVSYHATDKGSAGPGMEVAKNMTEALEPLQGQAGILVASIVKTAVPQLEVVNHGGNEGLPMLEGYQRRLEALRARPSAPPVALPFVSARPQRVATASAKLDELIARRAGSAAIPVAQRGVVPPKHEMAAVSASPPVRAAFLLPDYVPALIGPIRPAVRPAARSEPALAEPPRPVMRPDGLSGDGPTK